MPRMSRTVHDDFMLTVELHCGETDASQERTVCMAPPPAAPSMQMPRTSLAWACLVLAIILPIGLALFVLRYVVESRPALQPLPPTLSLMLEGGASVMILLGIPASGLAIGLGHVTLWRAGQAPFGRRSRRVARAGLVLGYLALGVMLAGAGFTAFWLGTHRMHFVW